MCALHQNTKILIGKLFQKYYDSQTNVSNFKKMTCVLRGEFFSMLCNMRSKLIPTDHIYIHKYRHFLSVDTFLNPDMYLKSLLIV